MGWLEGLFYGPGDYPEKLEVRTMWGPRHERLGPLVKQVIYPPNMTDGEKEPTEGSSGRNSEKRKAKPNREELVHLSNDILNRIQLDADTTGKSAVYYVLVTHLARDSQPYERFPIRGTPKGPRPVSEEGGEDEDDEMGGRGVRSLEKAFLLGVKQNQEALQLAFSMIEGLVDRQDRMTLRAEEALETTRTALYRQQDIVARAMDLSDEREMKRETHKLKLDLINKGVSTLQGLAPTLIPGLLGPGSSNPNIISESPESLTLKTFLKPINEGGRLTEKQVDAIFGAYDDKPEMNLISPGVLSKDQGRVIVEVANLKAHASDLERLLPGGSLEILPQQYMAMQAIFSDSLDQIVPLIAMFQMINQRVQQGKKTAETSSQTNP